MGKLSCGGNFLQCILVFVNIIFALLGVAVLVVGILLMVRDSLTGEFYENVDNVFAKIVVEGVNQSLSALINTVAIVAIVAGSVILIIGLLGCLGACCQSKTALIIYAVIVFLVLCAEVAVVVLAFLMKNEVEQKLKDKMNQTLYEDYQNDPEDAKDVAWNALFVKFQCCGVDDYMDLKNAKNYVADSSGFETSVFCCKDIEIDFPNVKSPKNDSTYECAKNPTEETSNYKTGCFERIKNIIFAYQIAIIVAGCVALFVEIVCILAACCLCRQVDSGDKMV